MNITERCEALKNEVCKYDTESFAGFFTYFIRQDLIELKETKIAKFESKLKDFQYLIGLNAFSDKRGSQKFELNEKALSQFADSISKIKKAYHPSEFDEHSLESILHTMAFQNYFHNGTLSYVEQDLEKIRRVFTHFNNIIEAHFGFSVDDAIEIYKLSELNFKIKLSDLTTFFKTDAFIEFQEKINNRKSSFAEAFEALPEQVQNDFERFHDTTYDAFLCTKSNYYIFERSKVECFFKCFSCSPNSETKFLYYTDVNPLTDTPILKLGEDRYLHVYQKQIPIAIYNQFYTFLLKKEHVFDKVRKHRENELEKKVKDIFHDLFKKEAFFYTNYYVQKNYEQDLLIIWKGVAFIIEIKATKMREPLRDIEKAITKIKSDFKDSVQYGYNQCKRVEDMFNGTDCFNLMNKDGHCLYSINPQKFHSVFSIVVTLERWGTLQTNLSLLLDKQPDDDYPWSVYIDDLETFLLGLKKHFRNPFGHFVTFLKERQKLHNRCYAIDELDICSEYLMDTPKFIKNVNNEDVVMWFSPQNSNYFDLLYRNNVLKFKEDAVLDPNRYFKGVPKDWDDAL